METGRGIPTTAFLILTYQFPNHLARLVERLQSEWATIYIHVDRKVNKAPFVSSVGSHAVTFVPDPLRIRIEWGSINTCYAIMRMMRMALPDAKRLCILSGSDYPAQSLAEIGRAFASPTEFIRIDRALSFNTPGGHHEYIRRPYFNHIKFFNPRAKLPPPGRFLVQKGLALAMGPIRRKPLAEPQLFHGSTWWALTDQAAVAALDYIESHPSLLQWFRYTHCPEEILMHSLMKAGPFAARIAQDLTSCPSAETFHPNLHGCHYIDWNYKGPGFLPKILDLTDLPAIQASSALFLRKTHPKRSRGLLDALDANA